MKKFLALLFVLALVVCASLTLAESADVTGLWYLTGASYQGVTMDPALMGLEMSMDLKADGTALLASSGADEQIGSWEMQDGAVLVNDTKSVLAFAVEDGALTNTMDGIELVFSREPNEAPTVVEISAPITAESTADFNGAWTNGFMVEPESGMQVPLSVIGAESSLEIADTLVTFYVNGEGLPMACQFTEGTLVFTEGENTLVVALHQGGVASLTTGGQTIYFTKAVEETAD